MITMSRNKNRILISVDQRKQRPLLDFTLPFSAASLLHIFFSRYSSLWVCLSSSCTTEPSAAPLYLTRGQIAPSVDNICVVYLVLLTTSFLIVVEDILSDVFPAVVVGGDMVHAFLHSFVTSPARVEKDAQQQYWKKEVQQSLIDE